jgi:outer membrane protein assembly factor BamB
VLTSAGHVVVAGVSAGRQALTAYTSGGLRQWSVRRSGPTTFYVSATAREVVIAGAHGAASAPVQAFALGTGAPTWSTTLTGAATSQPAVAGGVVYVTVGTSSTSSVDALRDGSGAVLWSFTYHQPAAAHVAFPLDASAPAVADGTLFVSLGGAGRVRAFGL